MVKMLHPLMGPQQAPSKDHGTRRLLRRKVQSALRMLDRDLGYPKNILVLAKGKHVKENPHVP
jgi:hypothetical protein